MLPQMNLCSSNSPFEVSLFSYLFPWEKSHFFFSKDQLALPQTLPRINHKATSELLVNVTEALTRAYLSHFQDLTKTLFLQLHRVACNCNSPVSLRLQQLLCYWDYNSNCNRCSCCCFCGIILPSFMRTPLLVYYQLHQQKLHKQLAYELINHTASYMTSVTVMNLSQWLK